MKTGNQRGVQTSTNAQKEALKKTREALHQVEARFNLFSLAEVDAVFISVKGVCVDQNDQAERMFGYSMDEAYGRPGTDWIVPEDRNRVMDNMLSGFEEPYQVTALRKDGSTFPCEITGRMIKHKNQVFRVTTVKDISSRKKLEKIAEKHKTLDQQYLDVAGVMVLGLDDQGILILINKKGCEILGWPEAEIIGKNWFDHFIPDRIKRNLIEVKNEVYHGSLKDYRYFENPVLTHNGTERLILWNNATLMDDQGTIIGTLSSGQDITESRKKETVQEVVYEIALAVNSTQDLLQLNQKIHELLSRIIDTSNYFVALKSETDGFLDVVYMIDSMDSIDRIPLKDSLSGIILKTNKPLLLINGVPADSTRIDHLPVLGSDAKSWLGVPLKIGGEVTGVLVVQSYTGEVIYDRHDLEVLEYVSQQIGLAIERKQREEALKEALAKAEESDRLKTAFLANVSHEIRTPLNSILGFSELLDDVSMDEETRRRYISIIQTGGEQLQAIIDDIINISLIESGQLTIKKTVFRVDELLIETTSLYSHLANNKGIQIISEGKATDLFSDKLRIRQILNNLVSNAIKYSDGGEIRLGYTRKKQELEFYCIDAGDGIPQEFQDKIFERFYRIEDTLHLNKGTGLGLPICKALVGRLGGRIWVESEPGKGAAFFFTVPLA